LPGEVAGDVHARRERREIEALLHTERCELLAGEGADGNANVLDVLLALLRGDRDFLQDALRLPLILRERQARSARSHVDEVHVSESEAKLEHVESSQAVERTSRLMFRINPFLLLFFTIDLMDDLNRKCLGVN